MSVTEITRRIGVIKEGEHRPPLSPSCLTKGQKCWLRAGLAAREDFRNFRCSRTYELLEPLWRALGDHQKLTPRGGRSWNGSALI
jgi:hypothetical protein